MIGLNYSSVMANVASPVIFVVSANPSHATALAKVLSTYQVVHIPSGDQLLRQSHMQPPHVVLLYTNTTGSSLAEVLSILKKRAELASTHWLAIGSEGLGDLLQVGVDAVLSGSTPTDALALQVNNLLFRAQQQYDYEERIANLQKRMDNWEHEERVRDQLVHMLVHDLKNPIAAVMGLIEVVSDDQRLPSDSRELLRVARDEAQHLLHLTVNMLDVRKIQAGKMNLRRELMFGPMFEEVIEQARGDVGSGLRDRYIEVDVEKGFSPANVDPEILRRIMANLISNALKHTTNGGHIKIKVRAKDGVHISVQDDGEGIPADDIPKLFAAFEQSRLTLHGRFDTGMGLAFCKMAVEEHGGRIWVESEWGHGALFTMRLPFAEDNDDDDDFAELLS